MALSTSVLRTALLMLIGLAGASALATKSFASTSLEREQAHTLQASLQAESAKAEGDKTHEAWDRASVVSAGVSVE